MMKVTVVCEEPEVGGLLKALVLLGLKRVDYELVEEVPHTQNKPREVVRTDERTGAQVIMDSLADGERDIRYLKNLFESLGIKKNGASPILTRLVQERKIRRTRPGVYVRV